MITISKSLDYRFPITLIVSFLFGLVFINLMPIFTKHPSMFLAPPLAAIFVLVLVIKPRAMFTLIFLFRPTLDVFLNLTRVDIEGQVIGFGAIINLIMIVLGVFLVFHEGNFPRKNPYVRNWIIFLIVMFFAVLYSPYMSRGARLFANFLSYFAMFLVPFLIIKSKEDLMVWLKLFAWSFVLPVLYSNIDLILGGQFYEDAGMRIKGTFSHPNILAFYLCLGFTYYFYLIKSGIFKLRRGVFVAMVLLMVNMIVLIIATKTRNAWIACFGCFFIYGLLKDWKALLVMFLLMPALLLVPTVRDRVVTAMDGQIQEVNYKGMNSLEWRLRMWQSSFPKIMQKPVQGWGISTFYPMSKNFSDVGTNGAHNMYIETLFESGIIGLFTLLLLLFKPLVTFYQYMRRAATRQESVRWAIAFSYLSSYVVICSADNLSYYLALNWYVWFFIAIMILCKKYLEPGEKNAAVKAC